MSENFKSGLDSHAHQLKFYFFTEEVLLLKWWKNIPWYHLSSALFPHHSKYQEQSCTTGHTALGTSLKLAHNTPEHQGWFFSSRRQLFISNWTEITSLCLIWQTLNSWTENGWTVFNSSLGNLFDNCSSSSSFLSSCIEEVWVHLHDCIHFHQLCCIRVARFGAGEGFSFVRRGQKLHPCLIKPVSAGYKTDQLLGKAEPSAAEVLTLG